MKPVLILLFAAATVTGCASKPERCDGSDKKPINTSRSTLNQTALPALPKQNLALKAEVEPKPTAAAAPIIAQKKQPNEWIAVTPATVEPKATTKATIAVVPAVVESKVVEKASLDVHGNEADSPIKSVAIDAPPKKSEELNAKQFNAQMVLIPPAAISPQEAPTTQTAKPAAANSAKAALSAAQNPAQPTKTVKFWWGKGE